MHDLIAYGGVIMAIIVALSGVAWVLIVEQWLALNALRDDVMGSGDVTVQAADELATRSRQRLNMIALLASVCPLLGLLGTVLGMMTSFESLQGSAGIHQGLLAGGISQALITTQAGLVFALPIYAGHAMLTARVTRHNVQLGLAEHARQRSIVETEGGNV